MPTPEIDKDIFDRETSMCKKLNKENGGGCNWGDCQSCGVIPLLHKLYKGELLEEAADVEKAKEELFSNN